MSRRLSHIALFLLLLGLSLSLPLIIQAIFPGGRADRAPRPAEERLSSAQALPATVEAQRVRDNVAWLQGDRGSVLNDGLSEDPAEDSEIPAETAETDPSLRADLRPGARLGAVRSWDTLEIRREQVTAGGFFFPARHTRIDFAGARLRFRDDTDKIHGNAIRLEGAHRTPGGWLVQEGIEHTRYNGLHDSWSGNLRAAGGLTDKLSLAVEAARRDMWERLANIRNRLRAWEAGLSLFYDILPRWWLAGLTHFRWISDHNVRFQSGAEVGHWIWPRAGLSAAAGFETTGFRDQRETYWSPSYYHHGYGRLRLSRNYEWTPFEPLRAAGMRFRDRLGYLAEVTSGVNNHGHPETSVRAGVAVRTAERVTLRAEFFHLDAHDRFEATYSENRVDASIEVRF